VGLPILECPEAFEGMNKGDEIEVNLKTGEIKNLSNGRTFQAQPIPPFMQELLNAGGLMEWVKKKVKAKSKK